MTDRPQVVKLAQPGIDVKTAGDEHLVYNSNWPLLKIYKQGSYTVSDASQYQVVTNHDLGYMPFFIYYSNATIETWGNGSFGSVGTAPRAEFQGPLSGGALNITKDRLELTNGAGGSFQIYYYIFALDLLTPYSAPQIKSGGVIGPRNTTIAFKLAKEGSNISSHKLEDYIVHSQARSPLVHRVASGQPTADSSTGGGFGYAFEVYHNLGYTPMFFLFGQNSDSLSSQEDHNGFIPQFISSGGALSITADEQKVKCITSDPNKKLSVVVLKDPFDIINPISVNV